MSKTQAINPIVKESEGLTKLFIQDRLVFFAEALEVAPQLLLGAYADKWPLTKVLDIGGAAVQPSFGGDPEVPPIPCHVHAGQVVDGRCTGCGKLEAYFFPPLDVPPYNLKLSGVFSRFGLRPDATPAQVVEAFRRFGQDDSLYALQNKYELGPWESWIIRPKIMHSPGPWLTFEIQTPQDDFNLLGWQVGRPLQGAEYADTKASQQMRGFSSEEQLFAETIDWDLNVDPAFKEKWHRPATVLEEGPWGRRIRIFHFEFNGEGFELLPGGKYTRPADARPFAAIVWSGEGTVNGQPASAEQMERKEFLVTPGTVLDLVNTGQGPLLIYSVLPLEAYSE